MENKIRTSPVTVLVLIGLLTSSCARQQVGDLLADAEVTIPEESQWIDYGTVLESGALGDWDYQLFGGLSICVVKKDDTYFLYYQGASGYRLADDTVTWRAIGVATSKDGINFEKYEGNPVLTHFPKNVGEEGATSCGALTDEQGQVVLYYSANTAEGREGRARLLVNSDGRLAVSADGFDFTDQGVVLSYRDPNLWGSGDELSPIAAFQHRGSWCVYYTPNGTPQRHTLGVTCGPQRTDLSVSGPVLRGRDVIAAWGAGGYARIAAEAFALFTRHEGAIEVSLGSYDRPDRLSEPVRIYPLGQAQSAVVFLDREKNTWFLYYRARGLQRYGVKLAPAGAPDPTPPVPGRLSARPFNDSEIQLAWPPATDEETGVVVYHLFRDGARIATVKGFGYHDVGLSELTPYSYELSALNYHGAESPRTAAVQAMTLADGTPPGIRSVSATGATRLVIELDEPVDEKTAEDPASYRLSGGITVEEAVLEDPATVVLQTSPQPMLRICTLTVRGLRDRSRATNEMARAVEVPYTVGPAAGLVGCWRFEQGSGETALDTSNFGSHGSLAYPGGAGPAWTAGRVGGALDFDGVDDLVNLGGSGVLAQATAHGHTFAAWAKPRQTPVPTPHSEGSYSILTRRNSGLFYDADQRFRATVKLADDGDLSVSSPPLPPDKWHHLAMVVEEKGRQVHLYVDGEEVPGSPRSYAGVLADHGTAEYLIGTSDPLVERWDFRFRGVIDEVYVYRRALDAAEVAVLAGAGSR